MTIENGEVSADLNSEEWAAREQLIRAVRRRLATRAAAAVEDYLPASGHDRRTVLVELVHTDLEYRLKDGEPAQVEEYLDRFPELKGDPAAELELITAELELRRARARAVDGGIPGTIPEYRLELVSTWRGRDHPGRMIPHHANAPGNIMNRWMLRSGGPELVVCPSGGAAVRSDRDDPGPVSGSLGSASTSRSRSSAAAPSASSIAPATSSSTELWP